MKTVERVLQLLLLFGEEKREHRVGEMADRLGLHRSVVSRIAATLAEGGFLERVSENGAFRLGPELGRLGMISLSGSHNLAAIALGPIERLADRVEETVTLAILESGKVVGIAQADGPSMIGLVNWVGRRTEPHRSSTGKALLAFTEGEGGDAPLEAFAGRTITSRQELNFQLESIRREGWASAVSEFEEGLNDVAVPVFDALGCCRAAVCVSGPEYRIPQERFPDLARHCRECAAEIGALMGRSPDAA